MPELPEVEATRLRLVAWLEPRIVAVDIRDAAVVRTALSTDPADALEGGARALKALLIGRRVASVVRHGKRLGVTWEDAQTALLLHFGMSGIWRHLPAGAPASQRRFGASVRLVLDLEDGSCAFYEDQRRLGCVAFCPTAEVLKTLSAGLGPDALVPLSGGALKARMSCRKAIKVALLEQDRLAGLGNIHAAEACFRARVDPSLRADRLSDAAWDALAEAIPVQLTSTLESIGDGELVYLSMGGENRFSVYGREGSPCPRCAAAVVRVVHQGRSTFFCPGCQGAPE